MYVTNLLLKEPDMKKRRALLKYIKNGSIVTWKHVNFYGEYDFSQEKLVDSIGFEIDKIKNYQIE